MIARIFESRTRCSKVLLLSFRVGFDRHRLVADAVDAEEVRQVQFGRCACLDADCCTIEVLGRRHTERFGNDETLTVVVVHANEIELEVRVAREGPGRVTSQHVDLARGQRGEARLARGRDEFNSGRIV